jgi:hypothetical protein
MTHADPPEAAQVSQLCNHQRARSDPTLCYRYKTIVKTRKARRIA